MNKARKINALIWVVIAIVIMVAAYFQWSENGGYTVRSFFCSLVVHGGGCFFIGCLIDEKLGGNNK